MWNRDLMIGNEPTMGGIKGLPRREKNGCVRVLLEQYLQVGFSMGSTKSRET
jgi:hypothetical protein